MKIQDLELSLIKPYKNNAKKHDKKQIDNVAESIKQFGFVQPIVLTADNIIIIGHCRFEAAKKLKLQTVPCLYVDELTEEQIKKLRNLDNKLNESEWDLELLSFDIDGLDFNGFDIDWNIPEEDESVELIEDEVPEIDDEEEPICKLGDIWQLGDHRLMCGDSTDRDTIKKLMDGDMADIVFTDPPYGMGKEKDGVENNNLYNEELLDFNKKWIPLSFQFTKENGSWYCWGIDEPLMDIYSLILKPMIKQKQITFRNLITWDKGNGQGQNSNETRMYATADEKCLFVMCGGEAIQGFSVNQDDYNPAMDKVRLYMVGEAERLGITPKKIKEICGCGMYSHWFSKSQFTIPTRENYKKLQEYYANNDGFKREYDELKREFYEGRSYFNNTHDNMNNVWHFTRTSEKERELTGEHATPKPIALCSRAIKSSSREDEIVLDLFGGSGSTLIACEQLNRKCYMIELSPKYCDVIIKRWETLTGKKAVKL